MKKSLPVTLDDLQATARDDKARMCEYRKITVFWNPIDNWSDKAYYVADAKEKRRVIERKLLGEAVK